MTFHNWATIDRLCAERQQLHDERQRLLIINTELLAALKGYQNYETSLEERQRRAIEAIRLAEGR